MKKKNVLINASNLHVGGGVQVAVSFIYELSRLYSEYLDFHILCSSEVDRNLGESDAEFRSFSSYSVYDTYGVSASFRGLPEAFSRYDAVFTVFGPCYVLGSKANHLVGFAQPWIIYPNNEVISNLSLFSRVKVRAKLYVQRYFFSKASKLVVELPHVKDRVVKYAVAGADAVEVVYNSVSSHYFDERKWQAFELPLYNEAFKIGFVGRDYDHKNLKILPEVRQILNRDYGINVEFYVTLSQSEWAARSSHFTKSVNTVGKLSMAQCPSFYKAMDGVIFPSLLECFSATPLEAMVMERPLFASDRGFVRDVCKGYAYYFDPLSPTSAAAIIAEYITKVYGTDRALLAEAKEHAQSFSSARGRAARYVRILEKMVV